MANCFNPSLALSSPRLSEKSIAVVVLLNPPILKAFEGLVAVNFVATWGILEMHRKTSLVLEGVVRNIYTVVAFHVMAHKTRRLLEHALC